MIVFIFIMSIIFTFTALIIISAVKQMKFAIYVLEQIAFFYNSGIITKTQAKVFLREMQNPHDTRAIIEVHRQLKEAYEKYQNSNR